VSDFLPLNMTALTRELMRGLPCKGSGKIARFVAFLLRDI
jgi:hypothetical protein